MDMAELAKAELDNAVTHSNGKPEDMPTVLAPADSVVGRIQMQGSGQLLGSFDGEIECAGELLVGKDARLVANIRTRDIVIAGFVRGNISASGRLRIASTGRLEGDARVGALIVQEGGVHHGVIRVHPEGLPADEPEPGAAAAAPALARTAISVDRVKKIWGEIF
jgi:cytoskeletal protein CcmA (bactofilin family)